ncbi:MAG: type II toxin-antitoxin system RelB/DinJ family antitoxin [Synergistaceae bacterium]|nr:type II toxin-antitoxin system RelB/DinJ family antitoxin [Synergistaceae bacterium]
MPQTTITIRTDAGTKKRFDEFCSEVGMNTSVAINMFMKATINAGELPFRVSRGRPAIDDDKFFSGANLAHLKRAITEAEAGKLTEHELLPDD